MLANPLTRDDIFVSYSRRDASLYAAGIADKLTKRELSCFIDKLGTEPNHDLPRSLKKKIRSCSVFVLIGTQGAAESAFVAKEIQEFKRTGRTILPIDFNGAVGNASWYPLVPGLAVESEENSLALKTGEPSTNVISFIEKSFNYTRRNRRMRRWLVGALSTFLLLVVLSGGMVMIARQQFEKATTAQKLAVSETEKATKATQLAAQKQQEASEAVTLANQSKEAARVASALAELKTNEAQAATILANEKTQLARQQEQIAISRQTAARAISRMPFDPEESVRLAETAYHKANTVEAENALRQAVFASHSRKVFGDTSSWVSLAAFDSAGRHVATSGPNETCVWDLGSGAKVCIPLMGDWRNLSFSPDGKYISLAHNREANLALLWEWQANRKIELQLDKSFRNEQADCFCRRIRHLSFSSDSQHIVGGGEDGIIWIWKTATGQLVNSWKERLVSPIGGTPDEILDLVFSKNNRFVLSADVDGQVRLWEWQASSVRTGYGNQLAGANPRVIRLGIYGGAATHATFGGPNEEYLLVAIDGKGTGSSHIEGYIEIFDTNTLQKIGGLNNVGDVFDASLSPNGQYVVTANKDNIARVWNWQSKETSQVPMLLRGHTAAIRSARFSPTGEYVVTASVDKTARLWKPATGRAILEQTKTSVEVPCFAILRGHSSDLINADFASDGLSILTSAMDRTARLWNAPLEVGWSVSNGPIPWTGTSLKTKEVLKTTSSGDLAVYDLRDMRVPLTKLPRARAFNNPVLSSNSGWVAGVSKDERIPDSPRQSVLVVWNRKSENELISLRGHTENINSVNFSHDPDGRYIVTASGHNLGNGLPPSTDNSVRVWDLTKPVSATNPVILRGHQSGVISASFSANDRYIVSVSDDGVMKVWDWRRGPTHELVQSVSGITQATIASVTFSPDDKYILAAGGAPFAALLWRWDPQSQLRDPTLLSGHTGYLTSAVFNADGKLILTSAMDGTERLWNTDTGQELAVLTGHESYSNSSSFISSSHFMTSGPDGLRIYECQKCVATDRLLTSRKR